MIYFTSDTHFYHSNVIEFCKRPWANVEEMNEGLIGRWNLLVRPEDQIYILGDMFFCGTIKAKEILKRLNGKKYLIQGNHDWGKIKKHRAEEFGFEFIVDQFCLSISRKDVILSHFPYRGDHMLESGQDRFLDKRPKDEGQWLLHGHVHSEWKTRGRMVNVGVDVWDWRPVSIETIRSLIDA